MTEPKSTTEKKTCVACFNSIDHRASKCPHCQSYQGLHRVAAFAAIIGGAALLLVLLIGALIMEHGMSRTIFRNNANYADLVTIQSSQMFFSPAQPEGGKTVSVVGRLTNESSKELSLIRLQVNVQNAENQLVDSFEGAVTGPLNPGDSTTFRVGTYNPIHLPESEYKTHTITVRQATADD